MTSTKKPKRRPAAKPSPKVRRGAPSYEIHAHIEPNMESHFRAECERLQVKALADSVEMENLKRSLQASRDLHLQATMRNCNLVERINKLIKEATPDLRGVRLIDAAKIQECLA